MDKYDLIAKINDCLEELTAAELKALLGIAEVYRCKHREVKH